jgi:hypothetical protein
MLYCSLEELESIMLVDECFEELLILLKKGLAAEIL